MRNIERGKKQLFLVAIVAIGIFLTLFTIIKINNTNENDQNNGTLLFLGNADMAPIIYEEDGIVQGVTVDIAKELGKKIGYQIEVVAMDWAEAQNKVLAGEADALLQINPNLERNKLYDFSDELLESDFSLFVKMGNNYFHKIADLKGKKVGVIKEGYAYEMLTEYSGIELIPIANLEGAFSDMRLNHLDAVIVDRWTGEYVLAEEEINDIEVVPAFLASQYSRIAVKKGNTEVLALINSGLESMREDGTMEKVLDEWRSERVFYFTFEIMRNMVIRTLVIVIGIILLIAGYSINKYRKLSENLKVDVASRTKELEQANDLLQRANTELRRRAMLDGLTEVMNRLGFDIAYAEMWEKSVRNQTSLALIMVDIDHFKCLNDTYGHLFGDEWIKRVAQTLQSFTQQSDHFAARYGGDEMVIAMADTNASKAAEIAESIRLKIGKMAAEELKENGPTVTLSLGVAAAIPTTDLLPDELIRCADEALYKAKAAGRNQTVIWK